MMITGVNFEIVHILFWVLTLKYWFVYSKIVTDFQIQEGKK